MKNLKDLLSRDTKEIQELELKFTQIKSDVRNLSAVITRIVTDLESIRPSSINSHADIEKLKNSVASMSHITQKKFEFYDSQLGYIDDILVRENIRITELEVPPEKKPSIVMSFLARHHLLIFAYALMLAAAAMLAWLTRINL